MKILLVDEKGQTLNQPYILRLPGWTEERYYLEGPRDQKAEFVRGELILMSPMSGKHSKLVTFLIALLSSYVDAKKLGVVMGGPTIRLESEINREPDICFIPQEKAEKTEGLPIEVVPPFIVEVSCTTRSMDLGEKALDYERAGVREYWVVDLEQDEVVVHLQEEGKYQKSSQKTGRLESREVKGFYIAIDWLWQKPLPSVFESLKAIIGF